MFGAFFCAPINILMANTILVGAQWGDEGKGKIIDVLTASADIVVRTQGGNNAGHTVYLGKDKFVLHLIPSGILRKGKVCVIANGVVVDPVSLVGEIEGLHKLGVKVDSKKPFAQRDRARRFAVSSRAGCAAGNPQGREQDRHHEARHWSGLRRQSRKGGHSRD